MFAKNHTVRRIFCFLNVLILSVLLSGCSSTPPPVQTAPTITALSPSSAVVGGPAFTLTVTGTGFVSGTVVQWNGSNRTTAFSDSTKVTASITASDLATAGTAQVLVVNPDAQKSTASIFTLTAPLPPPTIATLSPATAVAGGSAFTLTVNGSGFRAGAQVEWNGSAISATTVVSATQLTAPIPATLILTAGTVPVDVLNTDNGARSAAMSFTVTPARPTLSSLAPASATAGSSAITLTVNGTGFTSGAVVAWAGVARTTTFVDHTRLTAAIPASDLVTAGTFSVDVAQVGIRSTNQLNFTISPVQPSLASLSPTSVPAGNADFQLTVNGQNFLSSAVVTFDGIAKPTQFVSATELKASIPSSDVTTVRAITVDVVQGSLHASNTLSFNITAAAPIIMSLAPGTATVGGPAFTLSVNGTGFASNAVVQWNAAPLTTTWKSATLLEASVPASNLSTAGTVPITVVNPANAGGASSAKLFTISAPVSGKIVKLVSADVALAAGSSHKWATSNTLPSLSQDGRYVAFNSFPYDNVPGDDQASSMVGFLRDTCVGSAPAGCVPSTVRVTRDNPTHTGGVGLERTISLSNDARYAAFDTNGHRCEFAFVWIAATMA